MALDIEKARAAGYSDAEIVDHLSQSSTLDVNKARKAGYSDSDLLQHFRNAAPVAAPKQEAKVLPASDTSSDFMRGLSRALTIVYAIGCVKGRVLCLKALRRRAASARLWPAVRIHAEIKAHAVQRVGEVLPIAHRRGGHQVAVGAAVHLHNPIVEVHVVKACSLQARVL